MRRTGLLIAQTSLGCGAAWWVAHEVIGHSQPFFAPIAAVLSLGVSLGRRLRTVVELVVGVAVGVLVGDALIAVTPEGPWQVVAAVALAMAAAVFVGGGPMLVGQAATSAILIATILPADPSGALSLGRFVDALVGGVVGLLVGLVLLPFNPVVVVRRAVNPILGGLARSLHELASAMRAGDPGGAWTALQRARSLQGSLQSLADTLGSAHEVARAAPVRWRTRGHLTLYLDAAQHIDNAVRNTRVLARRAETMMRVGERPLPQLADAVGALAVGVDSLREDLGRGVEPTRVRRPVLEAAQVATQSLPATSRLSGSAVVAQVRSTATDLLLATGLQRHEVDDLLPTEEDTG